MQQPVQKKIITGFWTLVLLHLASIACNQTILQIITKPTLVPFLMLLLFSTQSSTRYKNILQTGLFFSFLGDLFLLNENRNGSFFIIGLVCFLITHICYIIYFLRIRSSNTSLLKKQPVFIALVLAYGILLVWMLYPYLGNLKLPVIIYATVICCMLLCSLHIFLKVNSKAAGYFLFGACAFVISDSLLAINKFYQSFAYAGVFIMLTYCIAQYFIVQGFIEQNNA